MWMLKHLQDTVRVYEDFAMLYLKIILCNVLQTWIFSTMLVSQKRELVIRSHPKLKPGELENLILDKSFPLPGSQSPHWKGDGVWGEGSCATRFPITSNLYCSVLSLRPWGKHCNPDCADEEEEALRGEVTYPRLWGSEFREGCQSQVFPEDPHLRHM